MKLYKILICALIAVASPCSAYAAKPKTLHEWEQCRDKAVSSVNQFEVGVAGVEVEIEMKCGEPPAREPSSSTGAVGMHPYDLVRSKAWKNKFVKITKGKYQSLVKRLTVAGETTLEGDWIVGNGLAPHMGGSEEAVFAINAKTGEVFAAMMEDGNKFSQFGFKSWQIAPPYLKTWLKERGPGLAIK